MGTKERLEILVGTQSKGKIQEIINDSLKRISNLEFEVEERDRRIDKAIEYIENHRIGNEYSYEYDLFQRNARTSDLLSILKGEDKE